MEPVLAALARFVARSPEGAIPGAVRDRAAVILADTVGAILGGSQEPEVRRLHAERRPGRRAWRRFSGRAFLSSSRGGRSWPTASPARCSSWTRGTGSRGVIPGSTCCRPRWRRPSGSGEPGGALLAALVVGYDVAARLGGGAPVRPGMHMHGVHGAVGAAAAVARLRELDEDVTARALGVAAGLTLGTSWRTALGGATVRNAYAGVAGANGWLAADLAVAGITPLPDMLTEIFGRISGSGLDAAAVLDGLGERFEVSRNYFKRHACCRYNHPAVDAIEELLEATRLDARADRVDPRRDLGPRRHDERPGPGRARSARSSRSRTRLAARLVLGEAGATAGWRPSESPRCPTPACARWPGGWRSWRIRR